MLGGKKSLDVDCEMSITAVVISSATATEASGVFSRQCPSVWRTPFFLHHVIKFLLMLFQAHGRLMSAAGSAGLNVQVYGFDASYAVRA